MANQIQRVESSARSDLMTIVGFFVAMVDGYDTLMLAFISPLISKEWVLTPQTIGELFASSYAGAAVGAAIIGAAADRFGRKPMLLLSLVVAGIFTMLCARAATPAHLMMLRAIGGLGLGGALSATTALVAAGAPADQRRSTVTRMFLGFPVGAIVGGAITAAVMSILGWRGLFLGGGACALLLIPAVTFSIVDTTSAGRKGVRGHSSRALFKLLADGRIPRTAFFCTAVLLMLLTSYFLVSWIPTVLTLHGATPRRAALAAVILNCGGIIGTLTLSFVFRRQGPIAPVIGCLCTGAILIGMLGYSLASPHWFVLVFAVGLLIIGAQGGIPALCVHLYPPPVYATAVGLSVACGRVGSIVGPLLGGVLVSGGVESRFMFLLAAGPAALAAVAMVALAIDAKRKSMLGLALEHAQTTT